MRASSSPAIPRCGWAGCSQARDPSTLVIRGCASARAALNCFRAPRRDAGEGAELEAWPEAEAAAAATAAKGVLPPQRRGLSLEAWAAELLQSVSITLVPVEVRAQRMLRRAMLRV